MDDTIELNGFVPRFGSSYEKGCCDMHIHTRYSDGTDSVGAVINAVIENRLNCFSITDHDITDGNKEAVKILKYLKQNGFDGYLPEFVPGVELSVEYNGEIHILGYFPSGEYAAIEEFLFEQRKSRSERNIELCRKLNTAGFKITLDELIRVGGENASRLHAAHILVSKGYVESVDDAFRNIFGYGGPCYVHRDRPDAEDGIRAIAMTEGIAVLAHPFLYGWTTACDETRFSRVSDVLVENIKRLSDMGLKGVEAYHGEASLIQKDETLAAATYFHMVVTSGSDHHGYNKSKTKIFRTCDLSFQNIRVTCLGLIERAEKFMVLGVTDSRVAFPHVAVRRESEFSASMKSCMDSLGVKAYSVEFEGIFFRRIGSLEIVIVYRIDIEDFSNDVNCLEFLTLTEIIERADSDMVIEIAENFRETRLFI